MEKHQLLKMERFMKPPTNYYNTIKQKVKLAHKIIGNNHYLY